MRPKLVFLMLVYMLLVYTTVHVYTASSTTEFQFGGRHSDLINTSSPAQDSVNIIFLNYSSPTTSRGYRFAHLNLTYGAYQGYNERFPGGSFNPMNWVATRRHEWLSDAGEYYYMTDTEHEAYLSGNYTEGGDENWLQSLFRFFSTVSDGFAYVVNLLFFNIANSDLVMSDGSTLPGYLTWLPLLMVSWVWIAITYWLLPYAIRMIHAIAEIIPL